MSLALLEGSAACLRPAMAARDLDFEEVSLLRERSAMLKDGYKSYLQSHPELTQLLGVLVGQVNVLI